LCHQVRRLGPTRLGHWLSLTPIGYRARLCHQACLASLCPWVGPT